MKTKISAILIAALFFSAATTFAQKTGDSRPETNRSEKMRPDVKPDSQHGGFLTEEQKDYMKKVRLETAKQLKPLKNELRELSARQQTLTTADKADLKAINENIDKIAGVKAEMAKIMAKQHQQIRAQLTDEQLIQFDSHKSKMMNNHQPHRRKMEPGKEKMNHRGA